MSDGQPGNDAWRLPESTPVAATGAPPAVGDPVASSSLSPLQAAPTRGTDAFAITGLVLALIGLAPLGLVFSVLALRRIRRRPAVGRGLAIDGLVICSVELVFMAVALVAALLSAPERDPDGHVSDGGTVNIGEVRVGDCLERMGNDELVDDLQLLPCDEPHRAELAVTFDLTGADYPGDNTIAADAKAGCAERLEDQAGGGANGAIDGTEGAGSGRSRRPDDSAARWEVS